MLFNDATLTENFAWIKKSPVPYIGVEEERKRRRLCPAAVSVLHHLSADTRIFLSVK